MQGVSSGNPAGLNGDGAGSRSCGAAPGPTWRILLPWLDWLAPSELLAMQRLGGPAQWWLRETPDQTGGRRPDLEDVFELLGSFLESAPLDDEPLSSLLPALPVTGTGTAPGLTAEVRAVLETAGGSTLGAMGRLTPRNILRVPLGTAGERRSVLAALVREGVQPGVTGAEPALPLEYGASWPSATDSPDGAVADWFGRLDSRQRDLIVHNLCAEAPLSVEVLAARHRTPREQMRELLAGLSRSLREEAGRQPMLGSAVTRFEDAAGEPVTRTDLAGRLPWLCFAPAAGDVTVLDVLAAVLLGASPAEEWLFAGSLTRARALTLEALAMVPGECLSLTAAARLLGDTGMPLKPTRAWLRSCGLNVVAGQVENAAGDRPVPDTDQETPRAHRPEDDENCLLVLPAVTVEPVQVWIDPESGADPLLRLLDELHTHVVQEAPGVRLLDLLAGKHSLSGPAGRLVARLLAATVEADGWVLPEELPQLVRLVVVADRANLAESSDDPERTEEAASAPIDGTLRERAWHVLDQGGHPMTTQVLAERMGDGVNLRSLKSQLPTDERFMRSNADTWALVAWGLRAYTTIKELIAEEIDNAGGVIPTAELVAILTKDFSIKESSLLQAASSPPFTARGGVVRRLGDTQGDNIVPLGRSATADTAVDRPDGEGPSTEDLIDLMGL
ncbi:hypothetical protein [Kitasatospora sp. NPDC087271]|uniref:hypothetical protein n=1 Tax=Kitasatospora sp. NPDC087271 TaxID=3364067 RepID=UPI0037F6A5C0